MEDKILQFIEENVGENAIRHEGEFWNIYNDKTVCSWGWIEPLKHIGQHIVYLKMSPL